MTLSNNDIEEIKSICRLDSNDITINVDDIAKWLNVSKKRVTETLRYSYKEHIDYTIEKAVNPNKKLRIRTTIKRY